MSPSPTIMADIRKSKTPAKYSDCYTGDELDSLVENDTQDASDNLEIMNTKFETLKTRTQIDGKTNNVTFTTSKGRISLWKHSILEHFGPSHASTMKDGKVIKVLFEAYKATNFLSNS